jgi:hypothetical protein
LGYLVLLGNFIISCLSLSVSLPVCLSLTSVSLSFSLSFSLSIFLPIRDSCWGVNNYLLEIYFLFLLLSQLADKLTIHSLPCSWIFRGQPFLKVHPPICRCTLHATMPGSEFSTNFVPSFDPNEWCLKNGLHIRGLELTTCQL